MRLKKGDYVKWHPENAMPTWLRQGKDRVLIVTKATEEFVAVKYLDTGEHAHSSDPVFYHHRFQPLPFLTLAAKAIKSKPEKENHESRRSQSQQK